MNIKNCIGFLSLRFPLGWVAEVPTSRLNSGRWRCFFPPYSTHRTLPATATLSDTGFRVCPCRRETTQGDARCSLTITPPPLNPQSRQICCWVGVSDLKLDVRLVHPLFRPWHTDLTGFGVKWPRGFLFLSFGVTLVVFLSGAASPLPLPSLW